MGVVLADCAGSPLGLSYAGNRVRMRITAVRKKAYRYSTTLKFSDGSCWEITFIKQIHAFTSNILFERRRFGLDLGWPSLYQVKWLDLIKAGAAQTETSLFQQYDAEERVDLLITLNLFFCCSFLIFCYCSLILPYCSFFSFFRQFSSWLHTEKDTVSPSQKVHFLTPRK